MSAYNNIHVLFKEENLDVVQSEKWFTALKHEINYLINEDFNGLIQLLYRIDVSEDKLRTALQQLPGNDAADIICRMIIERQAQKINSKHSSTPVTPVKDDEERW